MQINRGIALLAVAALIAGGFFLGSLGSSGTIEPAHAGVDGKKHDFALFDTTGGDTGATCESAGKFLIYLSVRAINDTATARVTFADGDLIDFPVAQDQSFSFTQAVGGTNGVDDVITVSKQGAGNLVGWLSAERAQPKKGVACSTTT